MGTAHYTRHVNNVILAAVNTPSGARDDAFYVKIAPENSVSAALLPLKFI